MFFFPSSFMSISFQNRKNMKQKNRKQDIKVKVFVKIKNKHNLYPISNLSLGLSLKLAMQQSI